MNFLKIKHFNPQKTFLNYSKTRHFSSQINNKLLENNIVEISDEIKHSNRPMVALESTIITHGLPYPANLEMALDVENEIKSVGAVPATVAFLNGRFKVGLSRQEIEFLAKSNKDAIKISRRDIPFLLSTNNRDYCIVGGTTVSATSIVAHAANIPIFCTGGIGGVHRDWSETMDVSADLQELARTPVAVISSGVKSILDIEKTLEYLETMGVCVVTLNQNGSKTFPSFFTSKSNYEAPYNCRSEYEAAKLIESNLSTGFDSGLLIAVPVPEKYSANDQEIENAIREALSEAARLKIKGKKVTPFLLAKINNLTKGKSLSSNLALIKNNAHVSGKIAVELHKLRNAQTSRSNDSNFDQVSVIGGINLDLTFKISDTKTMNINGVTQPGKFECNLGGVGRNMSEALCRLGIKNTKLISAVSDDMAGRFIFDESKKISAFDTSQILVLNTSTHSTGTYCGIFGPSGELRLAVGDMKAHDQITPELIEKNLDSILRSQLCVLDADIPQESIELICKFCENNSIPIWFNPTDIRKCYKITQHLSKLTYMSPNSKELFTIFKNSVEFDLGERNLHFDDLIKKYESNLDMDFEFDDVKTMLKYLLKHVPFIILSRGSRDLVLASARKLDLNKTDQLPLKYNLKQKLVQHDFEPYLYEFPIVKLGSNENFVNVSGCGDSASSGIIAGILKKYTLNCSIYNGLKSAQLALQTSRNISTELSKLTLNDIEFLVKENQSNIKILKL